MAKGYRYIDFQNLSNLFRRHLPTITSSMSEDRLGRGLLFRLIINLTIYDKLLFDRPKCWSTKQITFVNVFCSHSVAYSFLKFVEDNMAKVNLCILYLQGFHKWTKCKHSTKPESKLYDARFQSRTHQKSVPKQTPMSSFRHFILIMNIGPSQ